MNTTYSFSSDDKPVQAKSPESPIKEYVPYFFDYIINNFN